MSDRPAREAPRAFRTVVRSVERLTPHMIRVVLGGDDLAGFDPSRHADSYVKLLFPRPGVAYPEPFDMAAVRRDLPREQWPSTRTYTVRSFDPESLEMAVDFVHHGDEGLAGPWAANARPGDPMNLLGPGGGYAPDPSADWHLLVGDESALPAIAASVERLPDDARAHVLVEIANADEEVKLSAPAGAEVTWVHRGSGPVGSALVAAVRALSFPGGRVHAFVHGEAGFVKELRRLLRIDHGIPLEQLSVSGYWRLGSDDEAWRSVKADWNRRVEDEESAAAHEGR
ncbi:siderophore-interacting protein [Actinorugispora endophytica]|uniref:NADPH-dependent ferric siderophore reductase n=1 Tax=Actinorugispora endophytica TaxID=1605990 RepID=A0A4R6V6F1_9ACTN|nr:siderophore-interacting protein [Actinorugispora endophytica]TDQ54468.1 NADPH-dependent ferric siderophore reductase [Actinorugispora endophytica]